MNNYLLFPLAILFASPVILAQVQFNEDAGITTFTPDPRVSAAMQETTTELLGASNEYARGFCRALFISSVGQWQTFNYQNPDYDSDYFPQMGLNFILYDNNMSTYTEINCKTFVVRREQ